METEKSKLRIETEKLLTHTIFSFNNNTVTYDYFPDFIKNLFADYINLLKNNTAFWKEFFRAHYPSYPTDFDDENIFLKSIENLTEHIKKCIDAYYLGKVPTAYKYLESGLKEITYSTSKLFNEAIVTVEKEKFNGYRIRKRPEDWDKEFDVNQMFHIPFGSRGDVTTQRFSIPGHPSLYLGDSIYVCWEELNQPKLDYVYASRFVNIKPLKIIEIICKRELIERLNNKSDTVYTSELFRFLLTFPLNIACSIRTKNRNSNFKPEYIVPQLFLQYVAEKKNDIDGLRYYSTRVKTDKVKDVGISNYVFPTKTSDKNGYCKELIASFKLTEPLLWEHERIAKDGVTYLSGDPGKGIIELSKGREISYGWTAFNSFENALLGQNVDLKQITI